MAEQKMNMSTWSHDNDEDPKHVAKENRERQHAERLHREMKERENYRQAIYNLKNKTGKVNDKRAEERE